MKTSIQNLTAMFAPAVQQMMTIVHEDARAVGLESGGWLIVAPNGDHVHILIQSVHFVPGEELPF